MDFIKYIVIACVFVLIIHLHVCMKKKKNVVQVVTPSEPSEERETIEAFLSCMNVITKGNGENNNIPQLLEIIGKYYGAERAYLFEVGEKSDFGTYRGEWCATGVESHEFFFGEEEGSEEKTKDFLDKMPKEISEQYSKRNLKPNSLPDFSKMGENNAMMKNYDENGDFIMKSLDDIKFSNPLMFLTLKAMKINGLISTLIKSEGVVHALLGIENPTKHVDSLELLHAISEFVIYRIDRDRDLIKEYLVDALTGVNSARYIDFWKKNCEPEMWSYVKI